MEERQSYKLMVTGSSPVRRTRTSLKEIRCLHSNARTSPDKATMLSLWITADMSKQLDALGEQYGLKRSEVVRQLLQQALES